MVILLLKLALSVGLGAAEAREIAVIANSSLPAQSLRESDLRDLYLGEQQFIGKKKAKLLDLKEDSQLKKAFVEHVLGLTLPKYKTHWVQRVFQGYGFPPATTQADGVVGRVLQEDGAIGYIWLDELPSGAAVKILFKFNAI